jgi:hypothetical protein
VKKIIIILGLSLSLTATASAQDTAKAKIAYDQADENLAKIYKLETVDSKIKFVRKPEITEQTETDLVNEVLMAIYFCVNDSVNQMRVPFFLYDAQATKPNANVCTAKTCKQLYEGRYLKKK